MACNYKLDASSVLTAAGLPLTNLGPPELPLGPLSALSYLLLLLHLLQTSAGWD